MYISNLNEVILEMIHLYFTELLTTGIVLCINCLIFLTILIGIYEFIVFIYRHVKHRRWKKKQKSYNERMLSIRRKRLSSKEINDVYRKSRKEL